MSERLFLGIDGGQTSTKAVLADEIGNVRATGRGSPCDHINGPHGPERNRAAIHSAINAVLGASGADAASIVSVGMGLTSAPRELMVQPIFEGFVRELLNHEHIWIDHDVAGNLAGASAGAPGVVVIAGGGSIAYGIAADGREGKAGGMGYLMGDDGSAWWIGLSALQTAGAVADGRLPDSALLPMVLEHYNLPTIRHIVGILYGPNFTRDQVSGIASKVTALAATDPLARAIVREAGVRLASMVTAVLTQMDVSDQEIDVYPTGGVFQAGPELNDPFRQSLAHSNPRARILEPRFSPEYGALFRAYQAAGVQLSEELLTRLKR